MTNVQGFTFDGNGNVVVNLGTGGFTYLLGKYDGPNGASAVWNVQGLTGIVTIPPTGFGQLWPFPLVALWAGRRRCSGRRHHSNVARRGPRCAWHGAAIPQQVRSLNSFSTRKWPLVEAATFCLYGNGE